MSLIDLPHSGPSDGDEKTYGLRLGNVGLAILGLAFLTRLLGGLYLIYRHGNAVTLEFPDEQQYWFIAQNLLTAKGLADELGFQATRMPLYPALLALFVKLDHGMLLARIVQWIVGALSAWLIAAVALRLTQKKRVAYAAGVLVACDPFLVFFSSLLLTETPSIALTCLLLYLIVRDLTSTNSKSGDRRSLGITILLGLVCSLCVYTREANLPLVVLWMMVMAVGGRFSRRSVVSAVAVLLIVFVLLIPWAVRNKQVMGDWVFLTTRSGISLYDGVRPGADGGSDLGDIKAMPAVVGLSESKWNAYFKTESMRLIYEEPGRIFRLAAIKFSRTWNPLPNVDAYQSTMMKFVSSAWAIPLFAFAVCGVILWRRDKVCRVWCALALLLAPALVVALLHSIFVGSVRYRLVAHPMLAILAAYAVVDILKFLFVRREEGQDERSREQEANNEEAF